MTQELNLLVDPDLVHDILDILNKHLPGDVVKFTVIRKHDGRVEDVLVELGALDSNNQSLIDTDKIRNLRILAGLSTSNSPILTPQYASETIANMSPSVGFALANHKGKITISKLAPL